MNLIPEADTHRNTDSGVDRRQICQKDMDVHPNVIGGRVMLDLTIIMQHTV